MPIINVRGIIEVLSTMQSETYCCLNCGYIEKGFNEMPKRKKVKKWLFWGEVEGYKVCPNCKRIKTSFFQKIVFHYKYKRKILPGCCTMAGIMNKPEIRLVIKKHLSQKKTKK